MRFIERFSEAFGPSKWPRKPNRALPPANISALPRLRTSGAALPSCLLLFALAGCSHLHPKPVADVVYVMAKQTFLRDKVAAVSNRVAVVQNGQELTVLERGRRFLKVRTGKGEIGWIEERAVVPPATVKGFQDLAREHGGDRVVATAVLRDDLYMHLQPGRDTDRFYLLPENDKLQLLVRASVPKAQTPQATPSHSLSQSGNKKKDTTGKVPGPAHSPTQTSPPSPAAASGPGPAAAHASHPPPAAGSQNPAALHPGQPPPPPPAPFLPPDMEDWWLTRDKDGKVGWVLARRMDVDVPDSIAGYAEGQRMVGAYVLQRVTDDESNLPDKQVPEYVSVLSPYKDGLPYDFDQVRVFTWNLRKHRYETAYRQRNLQGYLPVSVAVQTLDKAGPVPTFSFKQGVGEAVLTDPQTHALKPAQTETETYRLDGVLIKKVLPAAPMPPAPVRAPVASPQTPAGSPTTPARAGRSRRGHRHRAGATKTGATKSGATKSRAVKTGAAKSGATKSRVATSAGKHRRR